MPDNVGERRECLIILEKVDWKAGLIKDLVTDAEVSFPATNFGLNRRGIAYEAKMTELRSC